MNKKKELAIKLHDKGYNCCQAVICAYADELGIDESILFKASEGFGLGMGCMDSTCGALSGAIMVAGFKNSTANLDGEKSKSETYALSRKLVEEFTNKNTSIICKDLKGVATGQPLRSCSGCIEDGIELVEKILAL